jgi:hypothetical protein
MLGRKLKCPVNRQGKENLLSRLRLRNSNAASFVQPIAEILTRERRSTKRPFEELRGRGYDGAHDSVIGRQLLSCQLLHELR